MRVQDYLRQEHVPFEVLNHQPTYDSQRMAHSVHVSGHEVAKTVLLRCDEDASYAIAVLPATRRIDLVKAGAALKTDKVELATEHEIHENCPECEFGALPPFGSCYDMATIADESLSEHDQILFEGDTHQESIRMNYFDYYQIEHPTIASIAYEGMAIENQDGQGGY